MAGAPESSEGLGVRCPLCGQAALLELCDPSGVALCPRCGLLLRWLQGRLTFLSGTLDAIELGASFADLGMDSLDIVELVVELEEEFDVQIPEDEAAQIKTVEDAIRCIARHLWGRGCR